MEITNTGKGFGQHGFNKYIGQVFVEAGESERLVLAPYNDISRPVTVTIIPLTKLTHGTVTDGPFVVGEVVSDGTLTARIIKVETGYILVADASGTFTTGTLTAISGATASLSAVATGTGLLRHSTSPNNADEGDFNIQDGTEIYGDSEDGTVSTYTSTCIITGVTALQFKSITIGCLFEVVM